MKRILITGAGSYIGTSFEAFMQHESDAYPVDTLDTLDGSWREKSFAPYDAIFCVVGIAHQKETKENAPLYYTVNRDLVAELAKKAKNEGVKQFVFLSSMSVYGKDTGIITRETVPAPTSHYGRSKLEAEDAILSLADEQFRVAVLRPPMVYGKGCKGNFGSVIRLVKKLPVFPRLKNERSAIYIDHLCAYVKLVIDRSLCGIFFPQNKEYTQTSQMAKHIAEALEKRLLLSRLLGLGVRLLRPLVKPAKKAFGSLTYDRSLEEFDFCYSTCDFEESIKNSI